MILGDGDEGEFEYVDGLRKMYKVPKSKPTMNPPEKGEHCDKCWVKLQWCNNPACECHSQKAEKECNCYAILIDRDETPHLNTCPMFATTDSAEKETYHTGGALLQIEDEHSLDWEAPTTDTAEKERVIVQVGLGTKILPLRDPTTNTAERAEHEARCPDCLSEKPIPHAHSNIPPATDTTEKKQDKCCCSESLIKKGHIEWCPLFKSTTDRSDWRERFDKAWKFGVDDVQRKANVKFLIEKELATAQFTGYQEGLVRGRTAAQAEIREMLENGIAIHQEIIRIHEGNMFPKSWHEGNINAHSVILNQLPVKE